MSTTSANDTDSPAPWGTPLQCLLTINNRLRDSTELSNELRTVNFMAYDLAHQCRDLDDTQTLTSLNNFFFEVKKFRIADAPVLLKEILSERVGCGISLALLYIHLASALDLDLELVHWPLHSILKWNSQSKTQYIDLEQKGKVLGEDELLLLINRHKEQVRTLNLREAILQYLSYISIHLRQTEKLTHLNACLGLILALEPENSRTLIERALLRKELGLLKESLADFKRYFAFNDTAKTSPEILATYEEVRLAVTTRDESLAE